MALIAKVIPVGAGYEVDMQAFLNEHPLLTLNDIEVHDVSENGISLTYDNTKEL